MYLNKKIWFFKFVFCFCFSSNLLYNLGESMSSNKRMLLKSDSKVHEKKDNKNTNEDKNDPPIILKYIKNQVKDK